MNTMQKAYKAIDFPPLTDEQRKELEQLGNTPDSELDLSDIPDSLPDSKVGLYYMQPAKIPKTDVHTKIDNDNLAWLKKPGKGYQARLNNVIRWARLHDCPIAQM